MRADFQRRQRQPSTSNHTGQSDFARSVTLECTRETDIDVSRARDVARSVELLARQQSRLGPELLARLIESELASRGGAVFGQRYRTSLQLRRLGVPVVICLSGTAAIGKSTLAARLSTALGIPHVTETCDLRQVLRSVTPANLIGEIHGPAFEVDDLFTLPDIDDRVRRRNQDIQTTAISRLTATSVQRVIHEGHSMILEGTHLRPGMIRDLLTDSGAPVVVIERLLTAKSSDRHAMHLQCSLRDAGLDPSEEDFFRGLASLRELQDDYIHNATETGVVAHDVERASELRYSIASELVDAAQALALHG